jgi:nitrogenase molybdenum-iron protein NifN
MTHVEGAGAATAVATVNPCRLCAPLGATVAIRGIENSMPVLHGSQGCATYIRRYLVSHFREPMDVASSSFGEQAAIFGGAANLELALDNVVERYAPSMIGVATTCLAETIGDDVRGIVQQWTKTRGSSAPRVVHVSTAAYAGSHSDGYAATVYAMVEQLAEGGPRSDHLNLFTPLSATPADLRALRALVEDAGLSSVLLPDFSETLDGGSWEHYERIPPGGTPVTAVVSAGTAIASLSLAGELEAAKGLKTRESAGSLLHERFGVTDHQLPLPLGLVGTDALMESVAALCGRPLPKYQSAERGRLVDAMIDAHKVLFEKRVALVGDPELVLGLARFCSELGLKPVLCASGAGAGRLTRALAAVGVQDCEVLEDTDHYRVELAAQKLELDLVLGPSKARSWSRSLGVPLIHLGFPIHDRLGAGRLRTLGYDGALQLLDRIANALMEHRQDQVGLGWSYL